MQSRVSNTGEQSKLRHAGLCLVIAMVVSLASCGENLLSPADSSARMTRLPDSPCGFLASADVAAATHLDVGDARRVHARTEDPGDGSICLYETRSELGTLVIVFPDALKAEECKERTPNEGALPQNHEGGPVTVCAARGTAVSVQAQHMIGNSYRATLLSLAEAVLRRVPDE